MPEIDVFMKHIGAATVGHWAILPDSETSRLRKFSRDDDVLER